MECTSNSPGSEMVEFWIGVDGGGSGTRVVIARPDGAVVGRGRAGPSALGQGIGQAWEQIQRAIRAAFAAATLPVASSAHCVLGMGLSGVHNKVWRETFLGANPGYAGIELASDATTMLFGAHGGRPGVMVAAGTGSVGEVLHADGARTSVGGWGFPVGDEGSGAWMGMQAARLAQAAMDGRTTASPLTKAVWDHCGNQRDSMQTWCANAKQFEYASLAPLVFTCHGRDALADAILTEACEELETMALALDPTQQLPVAFCGSIGELLRSRVSAGIQKRMVTPEGGALEGALALVKHSQGVSR
jgi:glucosamine kinase